MPALPLTTSRSPTAKGSSRRHVQPPLLPRRLRAALQAQIEAVQARHHQDLAQGFGDVDSSEALARLDTQSGCQPLRHSCATPLLEHGVNIHRLQALLGQADMQTTALDTQVIARDIRP